MKQTDRKRKTKKVKSNRNLKINSERKRSGKKFKMKQMDEIKKDVGT